jgi:predicted phosphodiesterase
MRVAIIADIHGNDLAFELVATEIAALRIDRVVCLGDAVQGGPQPAQVVARLRAHGWPTVLGNADAFLLSGEDTDTTPASAERRRILDETRDWSLAQLSAADRAVVAAFPMTLTVPLPGGRELRCCHGSPASFDDILLPTSTDEEFARLLAPEERAIYSGGHTHIQFIRHIGRTFFCNPGSVGNAWRHGQPAGQFRADPWAEYAILTVEDDGRLALEFRRVPFDAGAYRRIVAASGLPFAAAFSARYAEDTAPGRAAQ